jgi:hypothetical protein
MRLVPTFTGNRPSFGSYPATAALVLGVLAGVSSPAHAVAKPKSPGTMKAVSTTTTLAESVVNGSGATNTTGWRGASNAGPIGIKALGGVQASFGATTGVQLSRGSGPGTWAYALAELRSPATFFKIGQTYRMQAWVRDVSGTGKPIEMLLANGNYLHRPTETNETARFQDTGWHLISRTFVCTAPAYADTALYFGLPVSDAFNFEITGVSVASVAAPLPARIRTAPIRKLTFGGANGAAPDPAVWNYDTGGKWGNGSELQSYTARTSNVQVNGRGQLNIIARKEQFTGADGVTRGFTSGRITTENKVNVAPGSYIESTVTAPTGAGVWPAFWLVGSNMSKVGWPASGELDIFEGWGSTPTRAYSAVHMSAKDNASSDMQYGWNQAGGTTDLKQDLAVTPRRFGVYFDANVVRFYIDRKPTLSVWSTDALVSGRTWPFGLSQHIILNIAIPGNVNNSGTVFPKTMTVGDINIWKGGVPF